MKPPQTTSLLAITLLLLAVLILNGCKEKGCTDKNALNYNSAAGEDDGSCIICQTFSTKGDTSQNGLSDNNSLSPYYHNEIVKLSFTNFFKSYNNTACGFDSCITCLTIYNLVSKTITFNCILESFGPFNSLVINNITIPPNGVLNYGELFSYKSTSNCGIPSVEPRLQGAFSYH